MNKLRLLEIMKQLIALQKQGNLTIEGYLEIEKNTPLPALKDDLISYKETELICFLFKEVPYYQIFNFLNEFCVTINSIASTTPRVEPTMSLIGAYISDLIKNIHARTETEVNAHIGWLIQNYYQKGFLNPEKTIQALKRNSMNPETLTGMIEAQNIHYEQSLLPGFESQEEVLREKISKANYKKRSSIENSVLKSITKYFDETSFEGFLVSLKKCFACYKEQNNREGEILEEEIMMQIKLLYQRAKKSWQSTPKLKEDEGYQLKLEYFTT